MNGVMDKQIRVAIYSRVSTKEQAEEGYSIDEQERLLIEYCDKNNFVVFKCYADKGISGKNITARPGLKALLKEAEEGCFDLVISWKINRLSRKLKDALTIIELFERNNVTYRSYTEPFDNTTPAGKMQFQMMALIGEFERETIAQNVKMGMKARAREGRWCGGTPVLGYEIVKADDEKERKRPSTKMVINEEEARIVRLIFIMHCDGKGYKAIVNELNHRGYRTKKGNYFNISGVREILLNPIYAGKIRFNVRQDWSSKRRKGMNPNPIIVDGLHEPIIDEETWERSTLIMKTKRNKSVRIHKGFYPLTGLLKCPQCGAGMVISGAPDGNGGRITYYSCGNWRNKGSAVCHCNSIRHEKANAIVFERLSELLSDNKMVKEIVDTINKSRKEQAEPLRKELIQTEKELSMLAERKKRLFELYEDGHIAREEFLEQKDILNIQIQRLEEDKNRCNDKLADGDTLVSYELVQQTLKRFGEKMGQCEDQEKLKVLLRLLIKEITMDQARSIESIRIQINDDIINFLSEKEDVPQKGMSSILMPYTTNIEFCI